MQEEEGIATIVISEREGHEMKYTVEHISEGEDEVILRCRSKTAEVEELLQFLETRSRKLIGSRAGVQTVLEPSRILYLESVEGKTFAYTEQEVLQVEYSLTQLEQLLCTINFFRCSKSMILNIDKVKELRSLASNRIDATMSSGEHIIISRTYAAAFRKRLRGER